MTQPNHAYLMSHVDERPRSVFELAEGESMLVRKGEPIPGFGAHAGIDLVVQADIGSYRLIFRPAEANEV